MKINKIISSGEITDQKRSSSSADTDVSVMCKVCCGFIYFDFLILPRFYLVYGDTEHKINVSTSQCARIAGC